MDYSDNATRALLDSYRDSIGDAQATIANTRATIANSKATIARSSAIIERLNQPASQSLPDSIRDPKRQPPS